MKIDDKIFKYAPITKNRKRCHKASQRDDQAKLLFILHPIQYFMNGLSLLNLLSFVREEIQKGFVSTGHVKTGMQTEDILANWRLVEKLNYLIVTQPDIAYLRSTVS